MMIRSENIKTQVEVNSWEAAIYEAGTLLARANSCTSEYVEAMIGAVKELGPYIVLTPHVALAHARPGAMVKKNDISLVTLKEPVKFYHEANDPVKLVFAFCAEDNDGHLEQLVQLSNCLSEESTVKALANAKTSQEVLNVLNQ